MPSTTMTKELMPQAKHLAECFIEQSGMHMLKNLRGNIKYAALDRTKSCIILFSLTACEAMPYPKCKTTRSQFDSAAKKILSEHPELSELPVRLDSLNICIFAEKKALIRRNIDMFDTAPGID